MKNLLRKFFYLIEVQSTSSQCYAPLALEVVVKNGKIVFNPLEKSFNVENGKPIEARVLVQKK